MKKILICVFVLFFVMSTSACGTNENTAKLSKSTLDNVNNDVTQDTVESNLNDNHIIDDKEKPKKLIDAMRTAGERTKGLYNLDNINDTIIEVNDMPITRLEYEKLIIMSNVQNENTDNRDIVNSLIRTYVIKSEAQKLNIKPNLKDIKLYVEQQRSILNLDSIDAEIINAYLDGRGISYDEYLIELEEIAYDIFEREALRLQVEKNNKFNSFEEYTELLIKKAKIKFYDSSLEKLF